MRACYAVFRQIYGGREAADHDTLKDAVFLPRTDLDAGFVKLVGRSPNTALQVKYRVVDEIMPFSIASRHPGHSLIMFNHSSDLKPIPGQIRHIYMEDNHLKFAVCRQKALQFGVLDPFKEYPDFPAQTFSGGFLSDLEVVDISEVVGHYALWTLSPSYAFVVNLSPVRCKSTNFMLDLANGFL